MSIAKYKGEVEVDIRYEEIGGQLWFCLSDIALCMGVDKGGVYFAFRCKESKYITNEFSQRAIKTVSEDDVRTVLIKKKYAVNFLLWFGEFCDAHRPEPDSASTQVPTPNQTQIAMSNIIPLPPHQREEKEYVTEDIFINAYFGVKVSKELRDMMRNFLIAAKRITEKNSEENVTQKVVEI